MAASTPAIEKLQKKLDKEPNSLIFLQLAEEYRKESLYEDALRTCRDGLRRHPNYWSARVAMGRIYQEMGDSEKAREELEKVIKAVPDNLLANKLLGDIYRETERFSDALKRYQIVQMLTPNDQEVVSAIHAIEGRLAPPAPVSTHPAPVASPTIDEPEWSPTREIPSPLSAVPPEPPATPEEPAPFEIPSSLEKTEPGIRAGVFDPMDSTMPQESPAWPEPVSADPEPEQPEAAGSDLASMFMESAHSNEAQEVSPFAVSDGEGFLPFAQGGGDVSPADHSGSAAPLPEPRREDRTQPMQDKLEKEDAGEFEGDELTTQTLAELYVQQGLTDKAVRVYQKLLLNDPGNLQITQRLRELSPADALLSMAAYPERERVEAESRRQVASSGTGEHGNLDHVSEERKRKITTLENWLSTIRRERS